MGVVNPQARIGLIIPSSNRVTEPQFNKYANNEIGVHVTRVRMTGKWHKPLPQLTETILEAARALSDIKPGVIVFHCTASSMEEGLSSEARLVEQIHDVTGCPALTTGQAVREALSCLGVKRLVMITPYVEQTNLHEVTYLHEAGFEVIHELGLGLNGAGEYLRLTPDDWKEIAIKNMRPEAEGCFLSCTNTTMIEAIEKCEEKLGRPVVTSNQATLWACRQRLGLDGYIPGLGRLFKEKQKVYRG
jgi:maleate cis-trans isomerase